MTTLERLSPHVQAKLSYNLDRSPGSCCSTKPKRQHSGHWTLRHIRSLQICQQMLIP